MEHQDWEKYFCKPKKNNNDNKNKEKKGLTKEQKIEKKIDDGELKHKKITKEFSQLLQKARLSRNLTQKQLANNLNIQVSIINDYECCRGNYNGQIIGKLKRYLSIKI
jgi:putative transcription factor